MRNVAQQVVFITGASSGIGLVTAKKFAELGAKVFLVSRNEAALQQAQNDIVLAGGIAAYVTADVGSFAQLAAAADECLDRFGRIDTWVNNAGVAIYAKLLETPLSQHERLFRTNYFGVVHGAMIAIPRMSDEGAFITIASIAGDISSPIMGAYAASKHAVRGYIASLRMELRTAASRMTVTLIKPSGIDTPIAEHAANHMAGEAMIPPPIYDPSLVAAAIVDAARRPRREITVGGLGRLQVIAASHFPRLLDWLGTPIANILIDRDSPITPGDNLAEAAADERPRSKAQTGRSLSLYQ